MVIVAGPNGSGRTTLTSMLRSSNVQMGTYINADDIAERLSGDYTERVALAQHIAEQRRQNCLANGWSFTFETVMSHPSKLDLMKQAKASGYRVILYFVATDDPALNVRRVAQRVALGGHDVPTERIVARYARTLDLLPNAALIADEIALFDNTHIIRPGNPATGLRLVVRCVDGAATVLGPKPGWIIKAGF